MYLPASPVFGPRALLRARHSGNTRELAKTVLGAALLAAGGGFTPRVRVNVDPVGSIENELARVMGEPVHTAVFLGPPRSNRKPVLQVMDRRGRLMAIAKVAVNELTSRLVSNEARALVQLSRSTTTTLRSPRLIATFDWAGWPVVVQSPLAIRVSSSSNRVVLTRAMLEIAHLNGRQLHETSYLDNLSSRLDAMTDHPRAREAGKRFLSGTGADRRPLELGCWHGDLTRWNVSTVGTHVLVWDWERFAGGVPVGFDALHHDFLPRLTSGAALEGVGADLLRHAPEILQPFGVEPDQVGRTTALYLLEIASRFSGDGQLAAGNVAGRVEEWLLPALDTLEAGER